MKLIWWSLTVSLLIASSLSVSAPPAAAFPGGSCSVVLPSRLAVAAPYMRFTATLGSDCDATGKDWTAWDVDHSYYGPSDVLMFDTGVSSSVWDFYDWDHLGGYVLRPSGAYDAGSNALTQNTVNTSVRLWSRLYLTSERSGSTVTLRTAASRYTPSADGFRAWASTQVPVFSRTCSTCAWSYFRMLRTNINGRAWTSFTQSGTREYQARTGDINTTWGRSSAPTSR
jgi:hypothetical protein